MIYVLTTVGTSILGNLKKDKELKAEHIQWLDKINNASSFNIEDPVFNEIRERVKQISYTKKDDYYKLSAEITSLQMIRDESHKEQDIRIKFIVTDTIVSDAVTVLLQDFYENQPNYFNKKSLKDLKKIKGLQVKDFERFEKEGLVNLINEVNNIKEEIENDKKNKAEIILNLTGGYKGMIPFLTIFGQLYNIKINYIYEFSNSLIKFPQLPIQFDWFKAERYYNYLGERIPFNPNDKTFEELQENYLIKVVDNYYTVTSVGKLFFKYIRDKNIVSDNVMGHTMEYKLLEYYLENPYQDKYFYIKRSVDILDPENPNKKDLKSDSDLLMKENKESKEFITVESKPYTYIEQFLGDTNNGFIKQFIKQINLFKKRNKLCNENNPKEYLLHIYRDNENQDMSILDINLKSLRDIMQSEIPETKFKVLYFDTNITTTKDKKNPYATFMAEKLRKVEEYIF